MVENVLSSQQLAASGSTGDVLTKGAAGVNVWTAPDELSESTYVVAYDLAQPEDAQQLVAIRLWQDETLNVGDLANQIDYPRRLTVTATNNDLTNMTGTVTINGLDADGATIQEIITINLAPGPPDVQNTDRAFSLITTIVADQTDAHVADAYQVGTLDDWGVPNYPLNAAGDVFKAAVNGIDATIVAVVTAFGTVNLGGIGVATVPVVIFYRSTK